MTLTQTSATTSTTTAPMSRPSSLDQTSAGQTSLVTHSRSVGAQTTRSDQARYADGYGCDVAAGTDHRPGQEAHGAQQPDAGSVPLSPQATGALVAKLDSPAGPTSDSGHDGLDAQEPPVAVGTNLPADQTGADSQSVLVGGEQAEDGSAATTVATLPNPAPSLADPFLALAADVLDDTERTRIANENRLRQLTRAETDSDGEERGFGLDESHPDVARLAAFVGALRKIEHDATLNLNRLLRKHPLGPWVKAQKGIGDKQAARLLAVVGDPYWHATQDRPRLVSELWSYCGHGDPTRRIRKGMTQEELFACGSPVAKMRLHLIAEACLKAQGPYAETYYARKAVTAERVHATDCKRCGPSGHPALAGTSWSAAHRHADALRIVGKTILRDLWAEARRLHEA